ASGIFDMARPGDGHALPGAAEVRCHLLRPLERRIERPGPAYRHMRRGLVRTPSVIELQLLRDGNVYALNRGHLVRGAEGGPFGAGAVVAADVNDERVVKFAHVFHGLDDTANLVVGVSRVGGKDIRLTDEELLFIGRERVPFCELGTAKFGLSIRPGCE